LDKDLEGNDRIYQPVLNYEKLIKTIDIYMMDETKLNLVLFRDAIEHMSRVARVLAMQRGHFMVINIILKIIKI
jgi:dynein heavy chain